jgi:type VI secretion system protein ImpK
MKQQPSQHLKLLELAYLCLSMGFEGKYRVSNDRQGLRIIEQLRHELYDIINRTRGESERDLSINWKGLSDLRSPLRRYVPLWMLAVVTGSLLVIFYLGFVFAANRASDNVYGQLMALVQNKIDPPSPRSFLLEPSPVTPAPKPGIDLTARFRQLLANEIAQNMVEVIDGPILRISNAFLSGSEKVKAEYQPMLVKIAKELETGSRRIQVVGHTDNQSIMFSARFKSNWHLSVARAENIASVMSTSAVLKDRIIAEGRSDGDPIVKNDTAENRARNRRVDIHIW